MSPRTRTFLGDMRRGFVRGLLVAPFAFLIVGLYYDLALQAGVAHPDAKGWILFILILLVAL